MTDNPEQKKRASVPKGTEKTLHLLNGNQCAYCQCALAKEAQKPYGEFDYVGEVAHIRGVAPGAPRHDPSYPSKHINRIENLILLCSNCHKIVDSRPESFPVNELIRLKALSEKQSQFSVDLTDSKPAMLQRSSINHLKAPPGTPRAKVCRRCDGLLKFDTCINCGWVKPIFS